MVRNPETDTLTLKVVDPKAHLDLGEMNYNICNLLKKEGLQEIQQPFALKNAGPHTEIVVSLKLKVWNSNEGPLPATGVAWKPLEYGVCQKKSACVWSNRPLELTP